MSVALISLTLLGYVGPGPGLSMGAALLGLVATIFVAFLAFFSWPLRVALRKMRGKGGEDEGDERDDGDEGAGPDEEE